MRAALAHLHARLAKRDRPKLETAELAEIRAALAAGSSPQAALACAGDGVLADVVRATRLGSSLTHEAASVCTGDPGADLLVRALALAEQTGAGGLAAVRQAFAAVRDGAELQRLVRARSAQARGTALMLAVIPAVAWLLLIGLDPQTLGFYRSGVGLLTGAAAVGLMAAGRWWSLRLVARAGQAAAASDPLAPPRAAADPARALAAGLPALVIAGPLVGWMIALSLASVLAAICARPRQPGSSGRARLHPLPAVAEGGGGTAETVELVAVAVAGGLPTTAAIAAVAAVAPAPARNAMETAARRLRGGWTADAAFADSGLAALGKVLAISDRWGAPPGDALSGLAQDLRADRRSATEEAAERVQLALVFPTTLLTLPGFVLAVVPPLLWVAFA